MFEPDDDTQMQIESMRLLMREILRALVDSEEDVFVTAISSAEGTVLVIRAASTDIGKIIGKQGRTARSLRTVLSAASMKANHRFSMDVAEKTSAS